MIFHRALILLAAAVVAAPGLAGAHDYDGPAPIPSGATMVIEVHKTGEAFNSGATSVMASNRHFRRTLEPIPGGYRVTEITLDLNNGTPEQQLCHCEPPALIYETDLHLKPVRIVNWESYAKEVIRGFVAAKALTKAAGKEGLAQMLAMPEAEIIETYLFEQTMVSWPQVSALDIDVPVSETRPVPNPLIGPEIGFTRTIRLSAMDRVRGRATVVVDEALDPGSLDASIAASEDNLRKQRTTEDARPSEDQIPRLSYARSTHCTYEIDLATGLTIQGDCVATRLATTGTATLRRYEHWIMTQNLVTP